jgi:hypothetical protein
MRAVRLSWSTPVYAGLRLISTTLVAGILLVEPCSAEPIHQQIDSMIESRVDGVVAAPSSDAEFLRRVYLDLVGRIPSRAEATTFLDDASPDKRGELVDRLTASDEFPNRMTDLFHVVLMERMGDHEEWREYLHGSFTSNKPWDQIAREIASPDAENESTRASAFFITKRLEKYGQNPVDYPGLVRDFGRLMLGVDLQCSQCHDDLFVDDYEQVDFQGLFAILGQTSIRTDTQFPAVAEKLLIEKTEFKSVFVGAQELTGPRLPFTEKEIAILTFAKGEEYVLPPDRKKQFPGVPKFSPLKELSSNLPDHPMFRKNIANRLWWTMIGRGLVSPLDLHHSDNPPSHPELLAMLGDELATQKYDIRWYLRQLALTRAYQRSSVIPESLRDAAAVEDQTTFQIAIEKPLSNEQLVASLVQAVGDGVTVGPSPELLDAESDQEVEPKAPNPAVPDAKKGEVAEPTAAETKVVELRLRFAAAFAPPPRTAEVEHSPSVKAALFLMNDEVVLEWLLPKGNNLVARLTKEDDHQRLAEELYLSVLSRYPTDDEVTEVADHLSGRAEDRGSACGELAWALLASTEFGVNH